MKRVLLLAVAAAFLVAGCGDDSSSETTTAAETSIARVYFLRDGKVWPAAAREISEQADAADEILAKLLEGPTEDEVELGMTTALPDDLELPEVTPADGVARLEIATELSDEALAQIVYSLTQLDPVVQSVEIDGQSYTRSDFEDQTPSVLVESPLPFEKVTSPLRAEGTANTFEATFQYELTDTDGRIVHENFVTATSGSGTRGTFEFTTKPYTVPFDGIGSLIVFESSAEDGSRIHLVEIPLRMTR